jgi:hypothetical protein
LLTPSTRRRDIAQHVLRIGPHPGVRIVAGDGRQRRGIEQLRDGGAAHANVLVFARGGDDQLALAQRELGDVGEPHGRVRVVLARRRAKTIEQRRAAEIPGGTVSAVRGHAPTVDVEMPAGTDEIGGRRPAEVTRRRLSRLSAASDRIGMEVQDRASRRWCPASHARHEVRQGATRGRRAGDRHWAHPGVKVWETTRSPPPADRMLSLCGRPTRAA